MVLVIVWFVLKYI